MKIWIKVEIGAKAQVEERESICANDWEWTRGPNEVARPGSGEGSGGALGLRFPPSHPGTGTAPSLLPWVASKVNTLYPGLWATRAPSTAMKVIIMVIKNQHINPKGWLKEFWSPESRSLGSDRSSNSQTSEPFELITPDPLASTLNLSFTMLSKSLIHLISLMCHWLVVYLLWIVHHSGVMLMKLLFKNL